LLSWPIARRAQLELCDRVHIVRNYLAKQIELAQRIFGLKVSPLFQGQFLEVCARF
jgi:hypothetical protein